MKKILVYLNPAAGSGRSVEIWARLRAESPSLENARLVCDEDRDEALGAFRGALRDGAGSAGVLVIGGDGTLHRVAHEILALGLGEKIPLALIPAGTGSDLARYLGLPRRPEEALNRALSGQTRIIDALKVTASDGRVRYSVNVASGGISGVVDEAVNAQSRRTAWVYVAETLKAAAVFRSLPCRLLVDGELFFEGDAFLFALANSRFFGRGMKIAPRAEIDDGLMDVVVVGPIPRWQLPWRIAQVFLGAHLEAAPVRWCRARTVRLEVPATAPPLDLDGECFEAAEVSVSVLPGALRFLL